jgi:hypothetical protein
VLGAMQRFAEYGDSVEKVMHTTEKMNDKKNEEKCRKTTKKKSL